MRRSVRRSYGGAVQFILNVASETLFSFLLSPVMALTHTVFLFRLFLLRRGGAWNSQKRPSHAVPWHLALAAFWPHTLGGLAVIGVIAETTASDIGYAFMAAGGLVPDDLINAARCARVQQPDCGRGFMLFPVDGPPPRDIPSCGGVVSIHQPGASIWIS